MQLRILVLVGWKKTSNGLLPENLYFGTDGVKLQEAANDAAKTGDFVALRRFINPPGVPCPVTVDPLPTPPTFSKPGIKAPVKQQNETPAQEAHKVEAQKLEEKRLSALEKDQTDMATAREGKAFAELAKSTKAQLTEILSDLNSDLPEDKRVPVAPGAPKVELINSILVAQGVKKPAPANETNTENETN